MRGHPENGASRRGCPGRRDARGGGHPGEQASRRGGPGRGVQERGHPGNGASCEAGNGASGERGIRGRGCVGKEESEEGFRPGGRVVLGRDPLLVCFTVTGCSREVPAIDWARTALTCFSLPSSFPCLTCLSTNRPHLSRGAHGPSAPLGLQTKNQCLSVEQSTIFMLSQTSSSLSF